MKKGSKWALCLALTALFFSFVTALAQTTYTVQPGDNLSSIARRHNTSIAALVEANNIVNPNVITVGQQLIIPANGAAPPAPAASAAPAQTGTHVVQPGDSMYKIATQYGITFAELLAANEIDNPSIIVVGQTLIIPGTAVPAPAADNAPAADPTPAAPPAPQPGANLLLNPSFEEDWYHPNGIPELQIPQHWTFEWDTGPTGFGGAPWDVWVRPESRVLRSAFLPPHEHPLFIFHGDRTLKVFKGSGAISFRLLQPVTLEPGTYQLTINVFPDQIVGYANGQKYGPSDAYAGEVRFIVGGGGSGWIAPAFLQKNTLSHTFTIEAPQTVAVGAGFRGKFAIQNNGWFTDDWSLVKVN